MNVRTRIAATVLAAASLATIADTAQAATSTIPTAADKAAIKQANRVCEVVSDDYGWEACVVGEFSQITGRTLTGADYTISDRDGVVITGRSHAVSHNSGAATVNDRRQLRASFKQANYSASRELDAQWMDIMVGDFILERGRFISADWISFNDQGRPVLTHKSTRIHNLG